MAIAAAAKWELRSSATASNVNGGFFVTGASGTDYSQQDAAQYNLTGVTTAGADAILLSASAAADMVGNAAHIISGTNFTAGWYEIISVVAGVSITLDRTCTTAAGSSGVVNIGGAISLGAANDDAVFENAVAGHVFYMKQGTYTLGGTVNIAAAGTTIPISLEGYASTRGDRPTGDTRPVIVTGGTTMTFGANWNVRNVSFSRTADAFVCCTLGAGNVFTDCKASHTGGTANRAAFYLNEDAILIRCEAICTLGNAINAIGTNTLIGCYIHDSNVGAVMANTVTSCIVVNCVFDTFATTALDFVGAVTAHTLVMGNTFYGAASPTGTGVKILSGGTDLRVINNIIYGFTTGVSHGTAGQTIGVDMYNAYYNNTTNGTNWTLGLGSTTTAITFSDAANGNFTPTSTTEIGTALLGTFPGALSTGYSDKGAVQTQYGTGSAGGGGGGGANHLNISRFN